MIKAILRIPIVNKYWTIFNNSQVLKFIFVGGLNTLVGYGFFVLFIILNLHYALAVALSTIIGVVHSYLWNKFFTFKNNKKIDHQEVMRFILVYTAVYFINVGVLWIFVDHYHYNPLLVQPFALILVALTSYTGQKHWAFKEDEDI